ncbi:histidine kinase dimerization/phospho-acceptor domain-containing protein, partial [Priestia megaterium]|uniref:histidine kinase dimerization/phospho-acceptor domain-containing protein n=1 Tax=Priestia megaterium TaxID=1404 RepID=UPI00283B34EC
IVHELKNHLAVIKGAVYILSMSNQSRDIKEEVDRIERAADEAEKVIYTLLDYSRDDEKMEMVHVGTVIKQILLLSRKTLIRQNIEVKEMIDDDCYINMGSPEALKVILQNIIINAIQAISEDGLIDIFCG